VRWPVRSHAAAGEVCAKRCRSGDIAQRLPAHGGHPRDA